MFQNKYTIEFKLKYFSIEKVYTNSILPKNLISESYFLSEII